MGNHTRRAFMGRVGVSALAGVVGFSVARDLVLFGRSAEAESERLDFGEIEPLVDMIQVAEANALLTKLKVKIDAGVSLRTLVSAASLANVRTFGGHDYTGYHCFMAMIPALEMSTRLSGSRAALPVFKVLHRNARRIQQKGGRSREELKKIGSTAVSEGAVDVGARLLAASRRGDLDAAEARLLELVAENPKNAYAALQPVTRDNIDVHQVVLTFRSWDMLRLTGEERADVLLRQTLRQCIDRETARQRRGREVPSIRTLLPKLVDAHGLNREIAAGKQMSDTELEEVAEFVFGRSRDASAELVAKLLARGASRAEVGEALSLASARLLLHDPGKRRGEPGKPEGSVHGASVGLHASDSAHAWRGIGEATDASIANACLVTGAWHTAGQSGSMDPARPQHESARKDAAAVESDRLLGAIEEAVRGRDQAAASALAERYGETDGDPQALIDLLIGPAIEHDGALHHEKYFMTATQEFARSRPAHRWIHLVALTRVMASGYGFEAPGVQASKELLGV